jgi:hypothetical protein
MRVYIIRIVLKRRLSKYKTDLKLSLFSQSNKAMKFQILTAKVFENREGGKLVTNTS